LLFIKNGKFFSPKNNCYIGNTIKYLNKKININFKDIKIKDLNNYQEILLVGSGKGITSVETIDELGWKNQSFICSKKIKNIYKKLIL
jgi:4-amino-4-deoxychorismate lyase